jgi:shikimate dehydrogenase
MGDPVSHSLSPAVHNSSFYFAGINAVYLAFNVKDISEGVRAIRSLDIKGASITIPHKVSIIQLLDEPDDLSLKIGAANTVLNKSGKLYGYNSDCKGAIQALKDHTSIRGKETVIIGAGGAARAIGYGIISEGGKLSIINRTVGKGENLAKVLGSNFYPLNKLKKLDCDILINTTSLGMKPDIEKTPVDKKNLNNDMVVMDIVYNPMKTQLLKDAEKIGCDTISGISMFVYQAAFQFELWTGIKAPIEVMKRAVLDGLI